MKPSPWRIAACRRHAPICRLQVGAVFLFLFLLGNAGLLGAVADKNLDFLIKHWLAGDGLPENTAYSVAQTPDGYLWVGTSEGLLRFNGKIFEPAEQLLAEPKLNHLGARLVVDEKGRLWMGSDPGIMLRDENGWRELYPTNVTLRSVAVMSDGETFVGSALGQIFNFDGRRLRPLAAPPGLMPSGVFCVRDEKDGGLWLANRSFIGRLTKEGWQRIELESNVPPSLVAAPARGGGLWIYGSGRLRRYQTGAERRDFPAPKVEQPRQMIEDSRGRIWIASNSSGLACVNPDGTAQFLTDTNGLTHNSIWTIIEDREGNLWVGSSTGGLQRIRDRFFKSIGSDEGLRCLTVRSVSTGEPGTILAGTHGGSIAYIQNGKVVWTHSLTNDARTRYVWTVLRDSKQREWVGTYGNGLFVTENGVEKKFPISPEMDQGVYALMEDSTGRIWVGTIAGAGIIDGDQFQTVSDRLAGEAVRCFAEESPSGAMWMGTLQSGLFRLQGTNLTHLGTAEGLPDNRICSLMFDRHGCLWAGIFKYGLVCIKDGKISRVAAEQGLPAQTVGAMLADDQGNFWLGSDRGILRVKQTDLHRVAAGGQARAAFEIFNQSDGLDNAECAEGYQPTATRDADGLLWFATLNGVVNVNPARLRVIQLPPPVHIEKITFRDRDQLPHVLFAPRDTVVLPPGSTELEVHCAALSYTAPEKVQYAFQVLGVNNDWVTLGNEQVIAFHALSHGTYQLHVKAANNGGPWNETGTTIALILQPFVWQTLWFRALLLAVLLGLTGAIVWRSQRDKLRRQQILLTQQRAHAREKARQEDALKEKNTELERFTYTVSHDLKSPLITIKGFAGALLADVDAGRTDRLRPDLNRIANATDKMTGLLNGLLELSRVGRIINPPQPVDLYQLACDVVELLDGSIQARGARVTISPALPMVMGDPQRLQEVLQNLVENALKFAREDAVPEIEIGVVPEKSPPVLFVRDNGRGIEPRYHENVFGLFNKLDNHTAGNGIGLALVQRIIEFHGGRIWVESAGLGHGATFYFTLPTAAAGTRIDG